MVYETITMKEIIFTALISSLLSAYITGRMQRFFDKKKEDENLFFLVYMKLMELEGYYFWFVSAQIRSEAEPKEITQHIWRLNWEIADITRQLRATELQEILETLFLRGLTHDQRYKKLTVLISNLGNKINPKYKNIMEKISEQNLKTQI